MPASSKNSRRLLRADQLPSAVRRAVLAAIEAGSAQRPDPADFDDGADDAADPAAATRGSLAYYRGHPVEYCRDRFGIDLVGHQVAAAEALVRPPHRVLFESANGVGKTKLAAVLARWFYDCFRPGECVITAPREDQIRDTTFKEIRSIANNIPGLLPKANRLEDAPDHFIVGTTASDATAFQGRHPDSLFLIYEEGTGIAPAFFQAGRGMLQGCQRGFWLVIYNPTDPASYVAEARESGQWAVIRAAAFEHPNIAAELKSGPPVVPNAVRLGPLRDNMTADAAWGEWITEADHRATDIDLHDPGLYGTDHAGLDELIAAAVAYWPSRWWRPGPDGEARILGRYPSQSAYGIFAEPAFDRARRAALAWGVNDLPVIGCDVARFGDDTTAIHVRRGPVSLLHESYRKQDLVFTYGRLAALCRELAEASVAALDRTLTPWDVLIVVDDTGIGGGLTDMLRAPVPDGDRMRSFAVRPVNFAQAARDATSYPNARSEMLFDAAAQLRDGAIDLSRLDPAAFDRLRRQAIKYQYKYTLKSQRAALDKAKYKDEHGLSPDDVDAFCLAYYGGGGPVEAAPKPAPTRASLYERRRPAAFLAGRNASEDWNRKGVR